MTAKILDGKKLANWQQRAIKAKVAQRLSQSKRPPGLAVILVGEDEASKVYVHNKRQACLQVGFYSQSFNLPDQISQDALMALITKLNDDPKIDGILVQLPLPNHLDSNLILECIKPDKDVDGLHPYNLGRLAQRRPLFRPCTPYGIMRLLEYHQIDPKGFHATVVGTSNIVGRPMVLELLLAGATVTNCHRFTKDLGSFIKSSDLIVATVGKLGVINSEWIKPGSIVIDVGMHRLANGKLRGDIEFDIAKEKAAWITPVPGGVGPMTIAMLLENTLYAAEKLHPEG